MKSALSELNLAIPILAAPMAGGATTVAMVTSAAQAGGMGFLAAGYKTAEVLAAQMSEVRAAGIPYGVNVFAPNPVPVSTAEYRRYAAELQPDADRFGVALPPEPIDDDDAFEAKIETLLAAPAPVVSFTFGIPGAGVIRALQKAGTAVAQTVTSVSEAELANAAGADLLVVQGGNAGGHSGSLTPMQAPPRIPLVDLVRAISAAVPLPVIAAGGLAAATDISAVLRAGAQAAAVGTILLRSDESGASPTHRAALADPGRTETVITRAFTGRPARGLRNAFIDTHEPHAPLGYPAIHHLTSPLRKAAAAAGEPEWVHLWAGTGFRQATSEPSGSILSRLAGRL